MYQSYKTKRIEIGKINKTVELSQQAEGIYGEPTGAILEFDYKVTHVSGIEDSDMFIVQGEHQYSWEPADLFSKSLIKSTGWKKVRLDIIDYEKEELKLAVKLLLHFV